MVTKRVYEIDGAEFASLDGFYDAISTKLIPNAAWDRNLDAFNDILRGGFGTPENGFILRWKNAVMSTERLGYAETIQQLKSRLSRCHPENRSHIEGQITEAQTQRGPTVFDWLMEIIRDHGPNGTQHQDGVEIELC